MQSTNDDTLGVLGFTFADSVMTLHYIQISISYVIYFKFNFLCTGSDTLTLGPRDTAVYLVKLQICNA